MRLWGWLKFRIDGKHGYSSETDGIGRCSFAGLVIARCTCISFWCRLLYVTVVFSSFWYRVIMSLLDCKDCRSLWKLSTSSSSSWSLHVFNWSLYSVNCDEMWARSFKLRVFQVSCYKSVKWSGTLNGAGKLNALHLLRIVYFIGNSYKSPMTSFYCLFLKFWDKNCIFPWIFVSQKLETVCFL